MNTVEKPARSYRSILCKTGAGLFVIGTLMGMNGCPPGVGNPQISDGTMSGVNGWDVQATINVEPNSGASGTPVQMTIDFSRGGTDVAGIEIEDYAGSSCNHGTTWRGIIDQTGSTRWHLPLGRLYLTGVNGTSRFIALNSGGTRIAIGDIRVNGGCSISGRTIQPDGDAAEGTGVFTDRAP